MKKFTQLFITVLVFITAGAWSVSAWGQLYGKAVGDVVPDNAGRVKVSYNTNSSTYSNWSTTCASKEGSDGTNWRTSQYDFTMGFVAEETSDAYEFVGWYANEAGTGNPISSGNTTVTQTITAKSLLKGGDNYKSDKPATIIRYAHFKARPVFYFRATASTNNEAYGMAYVTFTESNKANSTTTEDKPNCYGTHYNTTSMTKTAYFRAVPNNGYVFMGWSTSDSEADIFETSTSYSEDLTSSSKDNLNPASIRYYAIFGEKFAPQITGTASVDKKVGDSYTADFSFKKTSLATPSSSNTADFYYTIKHELSPSSSVNNGTDVISYNPSTGAIQALNAGKATITFKNKPTSTHQAAEVSFVVNVTKKAPTFTCGTSMKVGANLSCTYTNTSAATPTANSSDNFYYVFSNNTPSGNTTGSDTPGAILTFSGNKVYGKNAGTGTITFYQKETYMYSADNKTINISVTKNDPVFTWNNGSTTYYHNTTITSVCSSTNKDFTFSIGTSTNELVAKESGNTLYVLSKAGTAQFTVSQAENYKWNSKEETFTVTPGTQSNHVPFTVSSSNNGTFEKSKSSNTSWDSNGYKLGDGGMDNNECEVIIGFTGIPEYLTFGKHLDNIWGQLPIGSKAIVYESADNSTWTEAWRNEERTEDVNSGNVALKTTTRYLKFYYYGSIYCHYNNIKVTELKKFEPSSTSLAFETNDINSEVAAKTFDLKYANVGHRLTLTTNDSHFTVSPTTITSIGGEKTGTYTSISVSYSTAEEHTSKGAKLTIADELGNSTTVNLSGKTVKLQPTVNWSSDAAYFNVDDVLRATNANGLTVTLSSTGNEAYVSCEGNAATMLEATAGTITITAHVEGNDIYADADFTKDITITNKEKQTIEWDNGDFSRLKTTDENKSITLDATATSGLPVSYKLEGDATGLTLTKNDQTGVWTLTYSSECKNTTIVAMQGGDGTYAPASNVSKTVKVIDPTKICDESETVVNSTVTMKETSNTYNIDIPKKMYVSVSRTKTSWAIYTVGVDFEFWSGRNGTGTKLYTKSYSASDINKSITDNEIDLSSYINAKSVKVVTESSNGYDINKITYTHQKYCNLSNITDNTLSFSTYPHTATSEQTFTVNYSHYPISLECSNNKFSFTPTSFGDCGENGSQPVSVSYTAGADEGEDVGYLYIKDNTGATLHTCTLNVTISKVDQKITSTNIETSYLTTDKVTLSAEANSGLTAFTYSASPAGIASFNGAEMTFAQSGTIAITVNQAGSNVYKPTSTTVSNIVVSKATPDIATAPTGTSLVYNQMLIKSTLSGGAADITLRGVDHSSVEGSFAWKNPSQQVTDDAGEHNYTVVFTPTDGNMYNTKEFTIPITIARAEQTLTMNNGEIKVAVSEGIDAGAADSKIDLDDLINTQTIDLVEASRAGVVSYEVISENKANANIAEGNIFSATEVGNYTIRATKAQTGYYSQVTADFTVAVGIRANTLTTAGPYEQFVEDVIGTVATTINSNGEIHSSSSDATIAYYDKANNKIVIPNSEAKSFDQKKVTIKIWQDATDYFEGISEANAKVITLTVKKYETSFGGVNYDMLVDGTQTGEYVFINTSAEAPSANSEDDFYYTFENTTFANEALNKGNELVTFDPETGVLTAKNAGATKIAFYQKETYKHTGATATYWIVVSKHSNEFSCVWNDESTEWTKLMDNNQSATVAITTNNKDYTNYSIAVEPIYGEGIANLSGTASSATITSTDEDGYAIWHLSQAEDYKYTSAEMDLTVAVGVEAPPTCYIVNDNTERTFSTDIQLGVYDDPIVINAPADKIWFSAKRQFAGANYFVAQYSVDNGISWRDICNPDLSTSYTDYGPYSFKGLQSNEFVTHIRFGAKTGATLSKWYKNVKVSRKSYLNIQNAGHEKIASLAMPTNTVENETTAKFYIDYSTCAGELTIASSDPHFTVDRSTISVDGDNLNDAKEEVTVTYTSDAEGNHVGVITVSSPYQVAALSVSGVTNKRAQTIEWNEGFNTDPITLAVGTVVNDDNIAAVASSTNRVYYASSDPTVIEIRNDGKEFAIVGEGTATLTVSAAGNYMWSDVSVDRTVVATNKQIQEISWDQVFPRFMEIGSQEDLDAKVYIRHGDHRTYSSTRTALLTYTCPHNNGIISVSGNKMTILAYGQTTVTAHVAGDGNYEAAAPMTVVVNVRQPSQGCPTPFVLDHEGTVSVLTNYSFSSFEYLESNSEILALDKTKNGKPDKLSFQYEGEEYTVVGLVPVLAGYVTAQQRIDGVWSNVSGSRVEPVKNKWNSIENLQLDERADAIRFYREAGGKGTHNFNDIKITRKQYLTASVASINLGNIQMGQTRVVNVEFDYSDVKGDLVARADNTTNGLTIANNGAIDVVCGSFGHYQLPVTIVPTQVGDWENTVYVKDPITELEIAVELTANVLAIDEVVIPIENGEWNANTEVPGTNASAIIDTDVEIKTNVTLENLTVSENVNVVVVSGNVNVGSLTIEEGATVVVKDGNTLTVGDGNSKELTTQYGNLYVENGGKVVLHEGELRVDGFYLDASLGSMTSHTQASSGQVKDQHKRLQASHAYFQMSFDPEGAITYGWYDFTVPFPVNVSGGISRIGSTDDRVMVSGKDFMIMEADEADRAAGGRGWHNLSGGALQPGKLYTITFNYNPSFDQNTFRFAWNGVGSLQNGNSYIAQYATGGDGTKNGLNGIGNGMLCHGYPAGSFVHIQAFDHSSNAYEMVTGNVSFAVGSAFFVQVNASSTINWTVDASGSRPVFAPQREVRTVDEFLLSLRPAEDSYAVDHLYFSASDEATEAYVIGHDLVKMGTMKDSKVARMWATKGGKVLCDVESQLVGTKASAPLSLFAPEASAFELEVEEAPEDASLFLTYNDRAIWNLSMSPYLFDLSKGTTEGYGLRLVADRQTTTDIENGEAAEGESGVRKVLIDNVLYLITPDGKMYDVVGKGVKF